MFFFCVFSADDLRTETLGLERKERLFNLKPGLAEQP